MLVETFAYVANNDGNTVSVINITTNTEVDAIAVGEYPYGVAITPNGEFAYVTNSLEKTVSVIDTTTNTEIKKIIVGNFPIAIAITQITKSKLSRGFQFTGFDKML